MISKTPLKPLLDKLLADARTKPRGVLLTEVVDAVLASPRFLPPIPDLALAHSERLAQRMRDPKGFKTDETDGRIRQTQWSRWHAQVSEHLRADGVDLLQSLAEVEPLDRMRYTKLAERVEAAFKALRALNLPWWQTCGIDEHGRRLSIVDICEDQFAKIDTRVIRRGGYAETEPLAWME